MHPQRPTLSYVDLRRASVRERPGPDHQPARALTTDNLPPPATPGNRIHWGGADLSLSLGAKGLGSYKSGMGDPKPDRELAPETANYVNSGQNRSQGYPLELPGKFCLWGSAPARFSTSMTALTRSRRSPSRGRRLCRSAVREDMFHEVPGQRMAMENFTDI